MSGGLSAEAAVDAMLKDLGGFGSLSRPAAISLLPATCSRAGSGG